MSYLKFDAFPWLLSLVLCLVIFILEPITWHGNKYSGIFIQDID